MATPTNDSYSGGSGATIYGGRGRNYPAWRQGIALNKTTLIPGSIGPTGVNLTAWGGFAVDGANGILYSACSGGHGDSSDNRVAKLNLNVDSPTWEVICTPSISSTVVVDATHYTDGKPSSRHIYDYNHFLPQSNEIFLAQARGVWGNGVDKMSRDAYRPSLGETGWYPASTHADNPGYGYGCSVDQVNSKILYVISDGSAFRFYDYATKTWGAQIVGAGIPARFPVVHDTLRNKFFCLQWGAGEDAGIAAAVSASVLSATGQVAITFNNSSGKTAFLADQTISAVSSGDYCGMTYDSSNDKFYWYSGRGVNAGKLYTITPNNGTVWDIAAFTFDAGSATLSASDNAGVNGRVKYVPSLKGFILSPKGGLDIYFVRTS